MTTGRTSRKALVLRGSVWGLGHTITLLSICGLLLVFGETISPRTEGVLELLVGLMLVLLGANVLRKFRTQRVHFHVHEHQGGVRHVHAHSHAQDDGKHLRGEHRHGHRELGLGRALAVGMVHGAAGSAGLLVLAAAADSLLNAVGFVITFGLGSIMGMAALSFVAAYPLRLLERCASWFNTAVTVAIGSIAVIIGTRLFAQSLGAL